MGQTKYGPPVVMGSEDIMAPKAHGTCTQPVQRDLRFGSSGSLGFKPLGIGQR